MGGLKGCPTARLWSEEEVRLLREHYPAHGNAWDGWSEVLSGRTGAAINRKASALGIRCDRSVWLENMARGRVDSGEMRERWTVAEDLAVMRAVRQAQVQTGRSGQAIVARARLLMDRHARGER